MTENEIKIEDVFKAFNGVSKMFSDPNQLDAIKLTYNQVALMVHPNVNMIAFTDLEQINKQMEPDFLNVYDNQIIISVFDPEPRELYRAGNKDIQLLRDLIIKISDYICSCTGSETIVTKDDVIIYLDADVLSFDNFKGVNDILGIKGNIIFDEQRSYILYDLKSDEEDLLNE